MHAIGYAWLKLWNINTSGNIRSTPTFSAFKKNSCKFDLDILTDSCLTAFYLVLNVFYVFLSYIYYAL